MAKFEVHPKKEEVLARLAKGESPKDLAAEYGISQVTVFNWKKKAKEKGKISEEKPAPTVKPEFIPPAQQNSDAFKAALRGAQKVNGPAAPGIPGAPAAAPSVAPITARGVLATCELAMNIGLTSFCAVKKINRNDPEIRSLLKLSPEEREMLTPLAEDAAPAWRELFGASGPGAVYLFLGAMGLTTIIRVIDLNGRAKERDERERKRSAEGDTRPQPSPVVPVPNPKPAGIIPRALPGAQSNP